MKSNASTANTQHSYKYEAFISYRHIEPDASVAIALHQALERFIIPPPLRKDGGAKTIGRIFRDQEELPTSSDLGRDIEDALHDSKWLIVICSPRLLESKWCMREVDSFIEQGRRDFILTLLVEGEPNESFPPQIRFADLDGETVEIEPLAADIRAHTLRDMKKNLKREKLRLLAPILGVTFDTLYQRAKKHARKTAAKIFGGIAAALMVFGVIIGYQAMQTAQANKLAAMERAAKLIASSESYITDGQQNPAVNAAREAFELARHHGIYEKTAEAALYRAIVQFPSSGSFAKLKHKADILKTVFSPDGSHIALWTRDHRITVWNTRYAIKLYEIDLAPDFFLLDSATRNMINIDTNWCSFCFNSNNELFVMDLSSLKLSRYSSDGTLLNETTENFACGIEYMSYLSSGNFVLYQPEVYYLRGADAIIISSFVSDDPANPSFNAALFAYDAKTGEKIYEYYFEPDIHYPISIQTAGDEESMVCYYAEVNAGMNCILLNKNVLRNGSLPRIYDFSREKAAYFCQLYDGVFLTMTSENKFAILDADKMVYYPLPDIAPPENADDAFYMLPGQRRGEFYAGFQSSRVNYYSFDSSVVSLIRTEIDVSEDTGTGTWIARFGWGNKNEGSVTYVCDLVSEACRRVVLDEHVYRHDYQYDILTGDYIFSNYGYYAETEGNLCVLYDFSRSNTELLREVLPARNQPGYTHVDMKQGLIVAQGSDEGGFYFDISKFNDGRPEPLHKVYLPDTKGYDVKENEIPYYDIAYAEDYAVILTHQPQEDGEGVGILYILHYQSGKIQASAPWNWDDVVISAINEKGILIGNFSTFWIFDPDDPTNVSEMDRQAFFPDEWLKTKIPFGRASGPSSRNIILWPYVGKSEDSHIKLGYLDLDTQQYVESDTDYVNNVNYPVLWSDSGNIFFALDDFSNFNVYSINSMSMLKREDFPEDVTGMQKIGGNIIALYSSQNAVEFYDMDSCKKLFALEPSAEAPQHISYNEENGLAVVSRITGFEIIDIRNGVYFYEPVSFAERLQFNQTSEIYITDDKHALLCCTRTRKQNDSGIYRNWYNYYLQDLPDAETLLRIARKFCRHSTVFL